MAFPSSTAPLMTSPWLTMWPGVGQSAARKLALRTLRAATARPQQRSPSAPAPTAARSQLATSPSPDAARSAAAERDASSVKSSCE
eukprot:6587807-Prymnesium_polylepis.1